MHRALEARSTHMGARHPVVAVTLRKLAELELAAAAAEEQAAAAAAAAAGGKAGKAAGPAAAEAAGTVDAPSTTIGTHGSGAPQQEQEQPLRVRERQQAVAIAQEALSIAQQAHHESLEWQRQKGQPEGGGGLLAWLRPATPQLKLSNMRRPQRPDSAALEVALCFQTLSHVHAAMQQQAAAVADLEQALKVLAEAFPAADVAAAAGQQQAEAGTAAAPASNSSQAEEGEQAAEGSGGDAGGTAAAAAAAVSAREQARAERVERARRQLACNLLAELLVLAQRGEGGKGKGPDLQRVRQHFAQEGCA
jgi:hypothetical protein